MSQNDKQEVEEVPIFNIQTANPYVVEKALTPLRISQLSKKTNKVISSTHRRSENLIHESFEFDSLVKDPLENSKQKIGRPSTSKPMELSKQIIVRPSTSTSDLYSKSKKASQISVSDLQSRKSKRMSDASNLVNKLQAKNHNQINQTRFQT